MAIPAVQIYQNLPKLVVDQQEWFSHIGFEPHSGGQHSVCDSRVNRKVLVAGRRWGKSEIAAKLAETKIILPYSRGWVVSENYDLTNKVMRVIKEDLILRMGLKTDKFQDSGPYKYEFSRTNTLACGSLVEGKSADHPESLKGEGLDWLIFDECAAAKQIVWEQYLLPTLTDREGDVLFISTPRGYNWFYYLWKRGLDDQYPNWECWRHPSSDNPYLNKEVIEEARRTMDPLLFAQEFLAEFTSLSGAVYPEFKEDVHVMNAAKMNEVIEPEWPRYRAIDFGYEHPFVCLWIAVDPSDRVYVYDEYYQHRKSITDHSRYITNYIPKTDRKRPVKEWHSVEWTVADKAARGDRAVLLEEGIPTIPSGGKVQDGIQTVHRFLDLRPDGVPGLLVSSDCKNTITTGQLYHYPENVINMDNPVKEDDDPWDCIRYFLHCWVRGRVKMYMPVAPRHENSKYHGVNKWIREA